METKPKIIADIHEKNSLVIAELVQLGAEVEIKSLKLADYMISSDVAVERKTITDFISSMIDKRLQRQLIDLKNNFKRPFLIIEKNDNNICKPSGFSNMHENAIRGMILSLVNFNIPFIFTENYEDTAKYILLLAKRQLNPKKEISLVVKRKAFSIKNQQSIILESFPGIGPSLAKSLLKQFKTIKNFASASLEDLEKIPKLGKKKAAIIKRLIEISY